MSIESIGSVAPPLDISRVTVWAGRRGQFLLLEQIGLHCIHSRVRFSVNWMFAGKKWRDVDPAEYS